MPTSFPFAGHSRTRRNPTRDELAQLRTMLEQQRRFREEQLAELRRPAPPGRSSAAEREIRDSLAAGARTALREVRQALLRMDAGEYGQCTSCGDPIGLERLEILPQVAVCMSCRHDA